MKILLAHNAYQQRGGEDSVVDAELQLLQSHGHQVATYFRSNDDIAQYSSVALARQTFWSKQTDTDVSTLIDDFRPDIIHVHNTFPLISPSLFWTADRKGIPVVQTLHNFRLMCLNALFLRQGRVCEDCIGQLPWRGVTRACYRDSRPASAALAGMLTLHRGLGTFQNKVTRYVALNEFCRQKFIQGGLPAERIRIKPNFVDFPAPDWQKRSGFLFVGRLSGEKGVSVLAAAAKLVSDIRIRVAGTGPESTLLEGIPGVQTLGALGETEVRDEMARAMALVLPSIWYENFPRTLVEALASGLPVIASRIGALAELIDDGRTGLLFNPADAQDLALKLKWVQDHPVEVRQMGQAARAHYESHFTPSENYRQLLAIYLDAIRDKQTAMELP